MNTFVCDVCGYVYDPAKGDPDGGVVPGTEFDKIPDDWVCPVCGATKESFSKQQFYVERRHPDWCRLKFFQ